MSISKLGYVRGSSSGRQLRPSTANFLKLKNTVHADRNSFLMMNKESPVNVKTQHYLNKRKTDVRTSKEVKTPGELNSLLIGVAPKKFTINDLGS